MKARNQIVIFTLVALFLTSTYLKPIQAENANNIVIANLKVLPSAIKVGDIFGINATLVNNSTDTIIVKNGCGGPFSVLFDNHAKVELKKVCNWMAVQITLKPGENITGTSLTSNLAYRAIGPGTANATVTFTYVLVNKNFPNLSFDNNSTSISKSLLYVISNQTGQTITHISAPLVQFKSGIAAKDVKCQQGLQLVIKADNGNPACVRPDTARQLLDIGWAKISS